MRRGLLERRGPPPRGEPIPEEPSEFLSTFHALNSVPNTYLPGDRPYGPREYARSARDDIVSDQQRRGAQRSQSTPSALSEPSTLKQDIIDRFSPAASQQQSTVLSHPGAIQPPYTSEGNGSPTESHGQHSDFQSRRDNGVEDSPASEWVYQTSEPRPADINNNRWNLPTRPPPDSALPLSISPRLSREEPRVIQHTTEPVRRQTYAEISTTVRQNAWGDNSLEHNLQNASFVPSSNLYQSPRISYTRDNEDRKRTSDDGNPPCIPGELSASPNYLASETNTYRESSSGASRQFPTQEYFHPEPEYFGPEDNRLGTRDSYLSPEDEYMRERQKLPTMNEWEYQVQIWQDGNLTRPLDNRLLLLDTQCTRGNWVSLNIAKSLRANRRELLEPIQFEVANGQYIFARWITTLALRGEGQSATLCKQFFIADNETRSYDIVLGQEDLGEFKRTNPPKFFTMHHPIQTSGRYFTFARSPTRADHFADDKIKLDGRKAEREKSAREDDETLRKAKAAKRKKDEQKRRDCSHRRDGHDKRGSYKGESSSASTGGRESSRRLQNGFNG